MQAGRFSADASHELRTPLTILRGCADQAIEHSQEGSDQQIRLCQMSDEIERLITITDKLLMLSKADAGSLTLKPARCHLSEMLMQLVLDAQSFDENIKITSNIQRSVYWLCDADLIHQLLINLYSNAVNYNVECGWIHIEMFLHKGILSIAFSNPSAKVSSDVIEKAFQRFYRGASEHSRSLDGHGLGLSLCQEIIRLHHGEIHMQVSSDNVVRVSLEVNPIALQSNDVSVHELFIDEEDHALSTAKPQFS
jgi:signal transduction histidine kinase